MPGQLQNIVRETFYISQDEEITTVIGRMRKTAEVSLCFVVPPRALVLASLINLKLLRREAQKMNKDIVIATQDEQGQAAAKKAGLRTQDFVEQPDFRNTMVVERPHVANRRIVTTESQTDIGEESTPEPIAPVQPLEPAPMKLVDSMGGQKPVLIEKRVTPTQPRRPARSARAPKRIDVPGISLSETREHDRLRESVLQVVRKNRSVPKEPPSNPLGGMFKKPEKHPFGQESIPKRSEPTRVVANTEDQTVSLTLGVKRAIFGFIAFGVILLSSACAYVFLPKAEIVAYAKKVTETVDYEFDAGLDGVTDGLRVVVFESVYESKSTYPATGKKVAPGGQKATGKVRIYNQYSSQDQPLVATTRVMSPDGKIFRLTKTVTVPGMKGDEPGTVEAEVKADEAGESLNIAPSRFTIPGFDGTAKQGKFYAQSERAFVGGGSAEGGQQLVVTQQDSDKAAEDLSAQIVRGALEEARSGPLAGLLIPENVIVVEELKSSVFPEVGAFSTIFEKSAQMRVKIVGYSEEKIRPLLVEKAESQVNLRETIPYRQTNMDIAYGNLSVDYEKRRIRIPVSATASFTAVTDKDTILKDLYGRSREDLQVFLDEHPELEKLDITISPAGLTKKVPKMRQRVNFRLAE